MLGKVCLVLTLMSLSCLSIAGIFVTIDGNVTAFDDKTVTIRDAHFENKLDKNKIPTDVLAKLKKPLKSGQAFGKYLVPKDSVISATKYRK